MNTFVIPPTPAVPVPNPQPTSFENLTHTVADQVDGAGYRAFILTVVDHDGLAQTHISHGDVDALVMSNSYRRAVTNLLDDRPQRR